MLAEAAGILVPAVADRADYGDQFEGLGLVALAAVLGGLIGAERSLAEKPAGLRTHMVVSALAAGIVFLGELLTEVYGRGDPSRALHGVITGIGFLGAGTIVVNRERGVIGLTTAAGLMFAATIGAMTGFGLVVLAAGSTVLVVVVIHLLNPLDAKIQHWEGGRRSSSDDGTSDDGNGDGDDRGGGGGAGRERGRGEDPVATTSADEAIEHGVSDPNTASPPGGGGGPGQGGSSAGAGQGGSI